LQNLRQEFSRLDADGDGKLDAADLESHTIMARAMFRNSFAMQIMAADLDGDGFVTADEIRRKLHYDRRNVAAQTPPGTPSPEQQIEAQVRKWLQADTDKDGKVTWHEALEAATREPNYGRSVEQFGSLIRQLQELAPQGKSVVTLADLVAAATAFFRRVDTDNNGTISTEELEAVRQTMSRYQALEQVRANCEMPKASQPAKVVLLGLYETESLSSVALGSQDEVTGVGDVAVEPGHDPLYIVIAGYRPTIWRFSGSLQRIERVVVLAQRGLTTKGSSNVMPLAGVVGVTRDKISFPKPNCIASFSETPSIASAQAAGAVRVAAGKAPDVIAGKYKLNKFNVPSGKIEVIEPDRPRVLVIEKPGGT